MPENRLEQTFEQTSKEVQEDKYLRSLEFDKVLEILSECANTPLGKAKCLELRPFSNKTTIEKELNFVTEAKRLCDDAGNSGAIPVNFIADAKNILTAQRLGAQDIWDLAKTLQTSRITKTFLQKNEGAKLLREEFLGKLISEKALEDEVFGIFNSDLTVKDTASSELKRLKNALNDTQDNLKILISGLLSNSDFVSHLQDTVYTKRDDRTVFQVKASDKSKVTGIVHDVSASNQTFFIEPEVLIPLHNRIRQIESEIRAEIERILFALSQKFHTIKPEILLTVEVLTALDCICARCKYSIQISGVSAELSDTKQVEIQAMRHPLLVATCENVVENDFHLNENVTSLIITGSNTGGKTVTLKTIGLLAVMTCAGMHIPALFCKIYPFRRVFADISEEQSITQSLSTFSAHINNVVKILNSATDKDLVLFDELGAGTDPEEGAALARSILEYLASKRVLTITTTHLGELKILQYQDPSFFNASVEFDTTTLKPTYKLLLGVAGVSNALYISENLNMPSEIVRNAKEFLAQNQNPASKVFNEIHKTHQEMVQKSKEAELSRLSAKETEETLEEKLNEIKTQKKKTIDTFKKKHQGQLEAARAEIKAVLEELRREKSEKIARRAYSRLANLENKVRAEFSDDEDEISQKYQPVDWNTIKTGQSVLIKDLNQVATLVSFPDGKGFCEVQIGLIKTKVKAQKLALTDKKPNKTLKKLQVSFDDFHASANFSPRVDLRGMRVDEALDVLEKRLDMASLRNIREITVIHGHGTGALKSAVRSYLGDSPYVAKYRAGEQNEGGDGISIVDIN
ncbi:MAG: endonuclease MutS2 [Candidatus Gastranaerophilales bacterium]|nr:endonuclease MutS2 [Candidatus Gastranaerophilales bacterium]